MGMRALVTASAVLAAGIMTMGAGVTAASVTKPAVRAGRTATASAARGGRASAGSTGSPDVRVREGICTSPPAYRELAARLSAGIQGALRGRAGHHAVTVYDAVTEVSCYADGDRHFDSASIVKAITLAALLRWHQETGEPLSPEEKDEATLMITQSDNDAATDLWNEVGMSRLQHFLDLAKMSETQLGQDGYWGLTQVTAHDEILLLQLLTRPNSVLSADSRSYQLGLMAQVISSQRWGAPAGAPAGMTVHVKNGWLPDDTGWHINSIGAFTGKDKNYLIAVLTDDNPSEQYGIDTTQAVARAAHRDLDEAKPADQARLAANVGPSTTASSPEPSSWAEVPALPTPSPAPK
jgi:beta-lactamase class A